jgi:hypothetical protein
MRCLVVMAVLVTASMAYAAPSKKAAVAFVKEMETVVKSSDKVLKGGSTQVIHDHSQRIHRMKDNADRLFVQADACSFAANSANQLWTSQLQQFQKPSQAGEGFVKRAMEDYRDNLGLCKQSLIKLK